MSEQAGTADERATYDTAAAEAKWRAVWDELQPFRAEDDSPREKKYALTMFPYPAVTCTWATRRSRRCTT